MSKSTAMLDIILQTVSNEKAIIDPIKAMERNIIKLMKSNQQIQNKQMQS